MNYPLSKYPKRGTHWEKNVFIERLEAELREIMKSDALRPYYYSAHSVIKEILGE